jgi:hypothetical protein
MGAITENSELRSEIEGFRFQARPPSSLYFGERGSRILAAGSLDVRHIGRLVLLRSYVQMTFEPG